MSLDPIILGANHHPVQGVLMRDKQRLRWLQRSWQADKPSDRRAFIHRTRQEVIELSQYRRKKFTRWWLTHVLAHPIPRHQFEDVLIAICISWNTGDITELHAQIVQSRGEFLWRADAQGEPLRSQLLGLESHLVEVLLQTDWSTDERQE